MHVTSVALLALGVLSLAYILNHIYVNIRHAFKAKELGCKKPVRAFAFIEPTGLYVLFRGISASNRKEFPVFIQTEFERLSVKHGRPVGTITSKSPLFRNSYVTTDPQNIQAMLALKFKDFGLGVNRTENFNPLLGNGIVSLHESELRPF